MSTTVDAEPFQAIVRRIGARGTLRRAWRLTGGVSAEITALELAQPGGSTRTLLVRRYGAVDLAQKQHVAQHEFQLLQLVRARGVLAPTPYYVDESCELLPSPYIVVEYIDGATDIEPANIDACVAQLAEQLVTIHSMPADAGSAFLPEHGKGFGERPTALDRALGEPQIRDALEAAWPLAHMNAPVVLHGDYWPGNVLWQADQLVAVIDWEDASVGDPLADLGSCRLELLWAFDAVVMQAFTQRYLSLAAVEAADLP